MRTRKRFGQHFLEPVWADKVIDAIAPSREDVFLEIGPGPGILTLRLAPKVSRLVAIEIDRDLIAELTPKLPANASIVPGDVLEIDLRTVLPQTPAPIRIAGNLPYNISSPILFRLLELQSLRPVTDATLMLQREVADRLTAKPRTKEYGVLSVLTQWRAHVSRELAIPPGAFRPPPDVRSALIRLTFRDPPFRLKDPVLFEQMVRSMFTQRRKTVANALAAFGAEIGVDPGDALAATGIDHRWRPETLEVIEIARLADTFAASKP
ncbi:MAG TPA: 16S rRNA (adenine(1518)-N(6)/adenine(1519)-N(6))-dimethyltransferase RsmA [Vicinamibacterales bacterium]|nr:16S rRNA (adenine(1518)-N(6)/adenine(1519)-N(6))-dimethyltransferase RsmA [Vicinamibacterales bacterium]